MILNVKKVDFRVDYVWYILCVLRVNCSQSNLKLFKRNKSYEFNETLRTMEIDRWIW